MSLKETVIKLMCIPVLLACFMQTASADWYDDLKPNGTWVEIEGNNFVADTFYGVPAYYNEDNRNYQCGELVIRFYKEAYGLDIRPYSEPLPTSLTEGYKFVKTSSPKAGDIIFVSAEMRGSSTDHWALVREYKDGYITMFEQNARYNGQAAIGRQIKYPSDSYYVYTPVSVGNAPAPVLKNAVTGEADKQPETEKQTTTEAPTTEKPTAPPTTAVPTTKAQTTVPVTATTKITTTKAETTKEEISSEISTEAATTDASVTESVTQVYSATEGLLTETQTHSSNQVHAVEEDKSRTELVAACAGVAVIVAAAAFIIKKKKQG